MEGRRHRRCCCRPARARLQEAGRQHTHLPPCPAAKYIKHLRDKGYNGLNVYGASNCWIRDVRAAAHAHQPLHTLLLDCTRPTRHVACPLHLLCRQITLVDCDNGIFVSGECAARFVLLATRRTVLHAAAHPPACTPCRIGLHHCAPRYHHSHQAPVSANVPLPAHTRAAAWPSRPLNVHAPRGVPRSAGGPRPACTGMVTTPSWLPRAATTW